MRLVLPLPFGPITRLNGINRRLALRRALKFRNTTEAITRANEARPASVHKGGRAYSPSPKRRRFATVVSQTLFKLSAVTMRLFLTSGSHRFYCLALAVIGLGAARS